MKIIVNIEKLKKSPFFTVRIQNVLEKNFVDSQGMIDLDVCSPYEFLRQKGAGRKSFDQLRAILVNLGIEYIQGNRWIRVTTNKGFYNLLQTRLNQ